MCLAQLLLGLAQCAADGHISMLVNCCWQWQQQLLQVQQQGVIFIQLKCSEIHRIHQVTLFSIICANSYVIILL